MFSEEEESKVEEVLKMLRNEVKKRRLLLYPYYRDFDRVSRMYYIVFCPPYHDNRNTPDYDQVYVIVIREYLYQMLNHKHIYVVYANK